MPGLIFFKLWTCLWQESTWIGRWLLSFSGQRPCWVMRVATFRKRIFYKLQQKYHRKYIHPNEPNNWHCEEGKPINLCFIYQYDQYYFMSWISQIKKSYEQGWRHIIRPPRTPYSEKALGPQFFKIQGVQGRRHDFVLTNSQGYDFSCSLWLPDTNERVNLIVYLHGNTSNRLEGMQYLHKIISNGMGLCSFDFNGCGNAEGQFISLGFYEKQQIRQVMEYLRKDQRIDKISLWGRSMGAVTALLYLPNDNQVTSVVLDSPFKSLKGLIEDMAAKTSSVPGFVLSTALKIMDRTIKEKAHFSISKLNPLKYGAPKIFIPGFFLVGIEDDVIPIQHTGQLFQVYGTDDKVIKMVNGGHNDNRSDLTIDLIVQFLKDKFQQEEKVQKSIPQTLDSKTQEKQEAFSPEPDKSENQPVETEEQVKEIKKTSKFSLSRILSIFSKEPDKKKQQKKVEDPIGASQNKEKKEDIPEEKIDKKGETSEKSVDKPHKKKKSKKSKRKKEDKKKEEPQQQQNAKVVQIQKYKNS